MVQKNHAPPQKPVLWRAAAEWLRVAAELLHRATSPCLPRALCYRLLSPPSDSDFTAEESDLPQNKLTVVLDLDETLVCTYEHGSLPAIVKRRAREAGLKYFELNYISESREWNGKPMTVYSTVFERPGLHEFLKQVSEFAVLVLFTAGLEVYAKPLVDKIDVENRFSRRLYRPFTVSKKKRQYVKDLVCVSENLSRVVLVDNNAASFLLQPANGIPCNSFSAWRPHDNELLEVVLPLLKRLARKKDVRPVLGEEFHMSEWFRMHGIPASGWTP